MYSCKRCDKYSLTPLCDDCEKDMEIHSDTDVDHSISCDYNKRLNAGFALIDACERPYGYFRIWS